MSTASLMFDEAIPDLTNAAQEAFNIPDPTPQLLELIHAHPHISTIQDIVIVCYELILQSPSQVNELAGVLVNHLQTTTITITAYDRLRKPIRARIDWVLNEQLVIAHERSCLGQVKPSPNFCVHNRLF